MSFETEAIDYLIETVPGLILPEERQHMSLPIAELIVTFDHAAQEATVKADRYFGVVKSRIGNFPYEEGIETLEASRLAANYTKLTSLLLADGITLREERDSGVIGYSRYELILEGWIKHQKGLPAEPLYGEDNGLLHPFSFADLFDPARPSGRGPARPAPGDTLG